LAIASTPGYQVFVQWVSDLGVGGGAAFFNSGVIVAGILAIPFAVGLAVALHPQRLGLAGAGFLAVAGVALVGVGVFTETAGDIHRQVSVAFFVLLMISMVLLAFPLYKSPSFGNWAGILTAIFVVVGVALAVAFNAGPLPETAVVLITAAWSLVIGWRLRSQPPAEQ